MRMILLSSLALLGVVSVAVGCPVGMASNRYAYSYGGISRAPVYYVPAPMAACPTEQPAPNYVPMPSYAPACGSAAASYGYAASAPSYAPAPAYDAGVGAGYGASYAGYSTYGAIRAPLGVGYAPRFFNQGYGAVRFRSFNSFHGGYGVNAFGRSPIVFRGARFPIARGVVRVATFPARVAFRGVRRVLAPRAFSHRAAFAPRSVVVPPRVAVRAPGVRVFVR